MHNGTTNDLEKIKRKFNFILKNDVKFFINPI